MHKITQVGVLSLAKIMGVTGAAMGLLIGILYGIMFAVMGLVSVGGAGAKGGPPAAAMLGMALAAAIGVPILYGVMSFVFGLIWGLILNFMFRVVGPLEVEIQAPAAPDKFD